MTNQAILDWVHCSGPANIRRLLLRYGARFGKSTESSAPKPLKPAHSKFTPKITGREAMARLRAERRGLDISHFPPRKRARGGGKQPKS